MKRDAVMVAIRRHDLHACIAAKRPLQDAARSAGIEARQGDVEGDYRMGFARGSCNGLSHRLGR